MTSGFSSYARAVQYGAWSWWAVENHSSAWS
jgi:hypothetical protein